MSNNGTPKSLKEAIANGLAEASYSDKALLVDTVYVHIKDILAQKFAAAYYTKNEEALKEMEKLWANITG